MDNKEYRLRLMETIKRSKYGNKTNDHGELYMEDVTVLTFESIEGGELKLSFSDEDLHNLRYEIESLRN